MYKEFTKQDFKIAKEYIILRIALKVIKHDLEAMKYRSALKLSGAFTTIIENAQNRIEYRLEQLKKHVIRVSKTSVASVYEVKIENRKGDILLDNIEIMLEIEKIILNECSI